MASIGWLHLSDLHQGLADDAHRWPSVRHTFFDDLSRLHDRTGPWDIVLFSGDLTQRGTHEEFARVDETLNRLWGRFAKLGSTPALMAVPGNHDVARPRRATAVVKVMQQWFKDTEISGEFWSSAENEYRRAVDEAFAPYRAFIERRPRPRGFTFHAGGLPGDGSVSFQRDGMSVAVVGLNSAFLQLEGGEYRGKLEVSPNQLRAACPGDDPHAWLAGHDITLLLTHHPIEWLHRDARETFLSDVAPPGRFFMHLFGHAHETLARKRISDGGAPTQRFEQAPSLFGLETWGACAGERVHGYAAARVTIEGDVGELRVWPRMLSKNTARAYQIVPDRTSALEDESHTETFKSTRPVTSSPAALEALDFIDTGHFGGDPLLARDLRAVFESLYPSAQDALRLARVARCDLERIRPEASAQAAWFELLEAARASGQTEALLRGALMDFPGHAGLSHCLGALGAHPLDGSVITEDAAELRGALSRLSDAQFEDVVSSLSSVTQLAPTSMMSSPERVIALVRACSERGSLPDLATAIERVRGRA